MLIIKRRKVGMKKNSFNRNLIVKVPLEQTIDYSELDISADVSLAFKSLCERLAGFQEYTPPYAVNLTYKYLCRVYKKILKRSLKLNRKLIAVKLRELEREFNTVNTSDGVKDDTPKREEENR